MREHHKAKLASFILLEKDGKILVTERMNTGYFDGMYQLPSGHVEENEYPVEAAVREAKEEVGVDIEVTDLEFVHASYRIKPDGSGTYIDFYFRTKKWMGEPTNAEPEKCGGLLWTSINELPENTVPAMREQVEYIKKGIQFSQIGRP